jgi:hypothetical protein
VQHIYNEVVGSLSSNSDRRFISVEVCSKFGVKWDDEIVRTSTSPYLFSLFHFLFFRWLISPNGGMKLQRIHNVNKFARFDERLVAGD